MGAQKLSFKYTHGYLRLWCITYCTVSFTPHHPRLSLRPELHLQLFGLPGCDSVQWRDQQAEERVWRHPEDDTGTGAGTSNINQVSTTQWYSLSNKNKTHKSSTHHFWSLSLAPGPGPGLPGPGHPTDHQQPADARHAKPHHVDQTAQPVTGKIHGPSGGLEGRDRGNWREDEDHDWRSVRHQSHGTASQHYSGSQVSDELTSCTSYKQWHTQLCNTLCFQISLYDHEHVFSWVIISDISNQTCRRPTDYNRFPQTGSRVH